jgi:predicted phage terminase large subunit-like protein
MNKDTINNLIQTKEGRRLLSIHSPSFFATYYLGYDYAEHQDVWLSECERLTTEAKTDNAKKKMLLLAPRDHGKSFLSIAYTVRRLCIDRNAKILWISASSGQAEKRVRMVKQFLNDPKIIADWASDDLPPFKNEETKWVSTQIYIVRPDESVDPSVEATGCGGSITGGHVDCIIMDDLEDDRTVYSSSVREKTREWLRGTVQPMLNRNGFMLVVGTRKHHDDVYAHMIKDPTFDVRNDPAISQMPESYTFDMGMDRDGRDVIRNVVVKGPSKVLWHDQRPIEYLLKEKQAVGGLLFAREFMNQVQSDDSAPFKWEWLERGKELGQYMAFGELPPVEQLQVVQGWDLALITDAKRAEDQDGDYTVGTTWGKDQDGNRYLLSMVRARGLTPTQLKRLIVDEYNRFRQFVTCVMIEKNAFGQLHLLNLQQTTDLPLKQHLTTAGAKSNPWTGVPALSALFENGKIVLPYREQETRDTVDVLCQELYGLGKEKHDDTAMSLWIAECAMRDASFQYAVSFGEDIEYDMYGKLQSQGDDLSGTYSERAEQQHLTGLWSNFDWYEEH